MKKLISILIVSVIIITYPITVYCVSNQEETALGLISFAYDTLNNILGMSYSQPEERLIDYLKSSGEALGWKYLQYQTDQLSKTPLYVLANRVFDMDIAKQVGDFAAGRYHAALVNRDYVDSIFESANKFIRSGVLNGIQSYGIKTIAPINYDENIKVYPPFYNPSSPELTGYIDITNAVNYNGVSIISSPGIAPVMYVPTGIDVYLYDRILPTDNLYVLISDNYLYKCPCGGRTAILLYSYNNGEGRSFEVGRGYFDGYQGDLLHIRDWENEYVYTFTSEATTLIPQYTQETLSYIAEYESHIGDTILAETQHVQPPQNIPYDPDDNIVMIIPDDRTFESNEIIYYSPETIKNYIDNGDIITEDYTTNLDEDTYNEVVNNYNEYINNEGGTNFDDSNILNKIGEVIKWLRKIYNKLTFNDIRNDPQYSSIFTNTPNYENFSDCITENVPIINEIKTAINSAQIETINTGFENALYTAPENAGIIERSFNGFKIDLNWYTPYRKRIYDILTSIIYGLGLVTCVKSVKSIFGIKEGDD